MDERFPRWLRRTVDFLSFLSLPNLGPLICGFAVLGFIGTHVLHVPMDQFVFDPQAFWNGEYWRLFAFPKVDDNIIWLLFLCLYVFFVFQLLEENWGEAPLTIFTLFSYVMALAASIFSGRPLNIWTHVLENISLAVGTLMPDLEFRLYFILPVKAKWLAWLAGAIFAMQFVVGTNNERLFLFLVLLPYFVFFGPLLYRSIRDKRRIARHRKRFDDFR